VALVGQAFETPGVEVIHSDLQLVSGPSGQQHTAARSFAPAGIEQAPQIADVSLQGRRGPGRWRTSPEVFDQPISRDELAGMNEEDGEERPFTSWSDGGKALNIHYFERT
jgi:hypothetical protein